MQALKLHNIATSNYDKVTAKAEDIVHRAFQNGQHRRYPLTFHIDFHRASENDMKRADQKTGYSYQVSNERTQLQRLLSSLKCKELQVLAAKTIILNSPKNINNFEEDPNPLQTASPPDKSFVKNKHNNNSVLGTKSGKGNKKTVEQEDIYEYVKVKQE